MQLGHISVLCAITLYAALVGWSSQAAIKPTSETDLSSDRCRLDLFHLIKNDKHEFQQNLQIAFISDNQSDNRYIALKADISHPAGYTNITYMQYGSPVDVFSINWRHNGNRHTVGRVVMLGGNSSQQAFDVFLSRIYQDKGHFELLENNQKYRFNISQQAIEDFIHCVRQHFSE